MPDYKKNPADSAEAVKELKDLLKKNKTVTLLYSSKFTEHNNAVALRDFLKQ